MYPGEGNGTHSSTLAWKIPWTEEPGRLQSMGSLRVGHDWATSLSLFTFMHWRRKWQPLQCSCLENPRDGEAWWAAIYGVAQSRTRLKWLSSSIHVSILPQSPPSRLTHNIEKSSMCYIVGPCQLSILNIAIIISILMCMKWRLIVALVHISIMISVAEHLFICSLIICLCSLEKYLQVLCCDFNWVIWFFCFWVVGILYIRSLDINYLQIYDLQIFPPIL